MSKVAITDTHLTSIANAIRTKLNSQDTYLPSEMAGAISEISGGEHTGAYKVNSTTEMNTITDMETGDYCVVESALTGYTPVEYIKTTGTQYIDTNFKPTDSTLYQTNFSIQSVTGGCYFGYTIGNENDAFRLFSYKTGGYNRWYLDYGSGESRNRISGGTMYTNTMYNLEVGNRYIKDLNTGTSIISSTSVSFANKNYNFKISNTGEQLTIYDFKIYDNNVLVRNMIPCYRNSDSVIGMYDMTNNVFYTNAGTGTFVKGADLTSPPPTLYKYNGTTWVQV